MSESVAPSLSTEQGRETKFTTESVTQTLCLAYSVITRGHMQAVKTDE